MVTEAISRIAVIGGTPDVILDFLKLLGVLAADLLHLSQLFLQTTDRRIEAAHELHDLNCDLGVDDEGASGRHREVIEVKKKKLK